MWNKKLCVPTQPSLAGFYLVTSLSRAWYFPLTDCLRVLLTYKGVKVRVKESGYIAKNIVTDINMPTEMSNVMHQTWTAFRLKELILLLLNNPCFS